jgi:uncharacterized protein YjbI with pentapeptide repeats
VANPEHLAKLKEGVQAWNEWRSKNPQTTPDLIRAEIADLNLGAIFTVRSSIQHAGRRSGTTLRGPTSVPVGINLTNVDFSEATIQRVSLTLADLTGAKLHQATLDKSILHRAILHHADLTNADLSYADFGLADLTDADLSGSYLYGTVLNHAILSRTNFARAVAGETEFLGLDFSSSVGLDKMRHQAPSFIDISSLYRSNVKIHPAFLRGCGVPENLIEYLPDLIGSLEPIQFYSCFISYSHKDEEFAQRLHARMEEEHLRVWYAPKDMKGGQKIHEQLVEAIRIYDKLLLVLSENSMGSEWVRTEIRRARKREISENRKILFPIRLVGMDAIRAWECFDADSGKDLAVEIREYHIPDFSGWKDHDQFEAAFARLLKDLKTEKK